MTLQGSGVPIEPAVLRAALRFEPDPPELQRAPRPGHALRGHRVGLLDARAALARRQLQVNGDTVRMVPSRIGRSLDMEAIAQSILDAPGTPRSARASR